MSRKHNSATEPQEARAHTPVASSHPNAYACGCLDIKYSGRYHIYSVYAAHRHCVRSVSGADTRGAKGGKKNPGKQFLLQVSHAPRYAIQNRTKKGIKRGRNLSQDANRNINNKTCTTAKMYCTCQRVSKNEYVHGNESYSGESLLL